MRVSVSLRCIKQMMAFFNDHNAGLSIVAGNRLLSAVKSWNILGGGGGGGGLSSKNDGGYCHHLLE